MKDARLILHYLDPTRVVSRFGEARLMRRCVHHACRPKFICYIDGLCINGCICGFSRKIIWLNVYQTNNDQKIIGGYCLDVKGNGGCS